jgi:hypothetical protein
MNDLVVRLLIWLAHTHPYLLLACAFIGSIWLLRSAVHKARLFTQALVTQIRGSKAELHEWGGDLAELRHELTRWKADR